MERQSASSFVHILVQIHISEQNKKNYFMNYLKLSYFFFYSGSNTVDDGKKWREGPETGCTGSWTKPDKCEC